MPEISSIAEASGETQPKYGDGMLDIVHDGLIMFMYSLIYKNRDLSL